MDADYTAWASAVAAFSVVQWRRYALHQGAPDQMTWPDRWKICFASVIVWTENLKRCYHIWPICFILTVKQSVALTACVLRATTKKGRQLFWGKKCTQRKSWLRLWLRVTWLEDFLTSQWPGSCASAATGAIVCWTDHLFIVIMANAYRTPIYR